VRTGDIFVGINNHDVASLQQLESRLSGLKPGVMVTIRYTRGSSTVHKSSGKLGTLSYG
jgi:S1-C subfamily serine protease